MQFVDAVLGQTRAPVALEGERLGHDADRKDALLAGGARHHRRCAGPGAAAHARGDEHHVGTAQVIVDLVVAFLGGGSPDLRMRAGAEALGDGDTELNDALRTAERQGLCVGIGTDEVHAGQPRGDHVVDGVAAGAADTENGDARLQFLDVRDGEVDRHGGPRGSRSAIISRRQFVNRLLTIEGNPLTKMHFATGGEPIGNRCPIAHSAPVSGAQRLERPRNWSAASYLRGRSSRPSPLT